MDAIILSGAPGIGKSTIALKLNERFGWPHLDLGRLREVYLDPQWKTANSKEAQMSFEILCYMVHRHVDHGFKNILIVDLLPEHIDQLIKQFGDLSYLVISFITKDKSVHLRRINDPTRDSGFRDFEKAAAWNDSIILREPLPRETILDTTKNEISDTIEQVIQIIRQAEGGRM